jgi:hypothetical protein
MCVVVRLEAAAALSFLGFKIIYAQSLCCGGAMVTSVKGW